MLFDVAHVLLLSASNCSIHDMKAGMLPVLADSILLTARLYITQSLYVSKNQLPQHTTLIMYTKHGLDIDMVQLFNKL